MIKRVCCLYRVSTDKQVIYDDRHNADIPMQRKECHRFADLQGWTIVMEEQEEGVSGHKVRAADRDKLQLIKKAAMQKKFDIFLVFMFDRIGRIADETPFVVEWFVKNGIQVWSTQEGEQRFESHADKLMNYIRFWQADGESEKTSIRTRTRLGQLTEEGHFTGGCAPYGYRLIEGERISRHKRRLYELEVIPEEARVVRLIFEKYANEGYGTQRIATFLNQSGCRARTGKPWHHASIRGIVCNLTYTGILRCGESRSPVQPHLQIVSQELFDAAQQVRLGRNGTIKDFHVPKSTAGQSLLLGNVFCADCGSRLNPIQNSTRTSSGKKVTRLRYICYGRKFKQVPCSGQSTYNMMKVDDAVDGIVRQVFAAMKCFSREELVRGQYQRKVQEADEALEAAQDACQKSWRNLEILKAEVIVSLRGNSNFSAKLLSEMIQQQEEKYAQLCEELANAELLQQHSQLLLQELERQYDTALAMADMYDRASWEAKKMIICRTVQRVEVSRNYKINVIFRPEYRGYLEIAEEIQEELA